MDRKRTGKSQWIIALLFILFASFVSVDFFLKLRTMNPFGYEQTGMAKEVPLGILIPGEILHHAAHGCRNMIVLQPFGCLPNHVVGRGLIKKMKELYPHIQILPLDYDPDVSFANVENRLQMMIMNEKSRSVSAK